MLSHTTISTRDLLNYFLSTSLKCLFFSIRHNADTNFFVLIISFLFFPEHRFSIDCQKLDYWIKDMISKIPFAK